MVKRFFVVSMAILLPILMLFTVYRASVGIGPLSLASVVSLLGNSFQRTDNQLQAIFVDFGQAVDGILSIAKPNLPSLSSGDFFDFFDGLLKIMLGTVGYSFFWLLYLLWNLLFLIVFIIQDISDMIRIVGFFIVGVSPYKYVPYFPTVG